MAAHGNVINWEEAMQQCGDDEEFLHELLADFKSELETQLTSIAATIQVRTATGHCAVHSNRTNICHREFDFIYIF